jgi:hypothetical protein
MRVSCNKLVGGREGFGCLGCKGAFNPYVRSLQMCGLQGRSRPVGTVDRKCKDKKWSTYCPQHLNHRKKPLLRNRMNLFKDHEIPVTNSAQESCTYKTDLFSSTRFLSGYRNEILIKRERGDALFRAIVHQYGDCDPAFIWWGAVEK